MHTGKPKKRPPATVVYLPEELRERLDRLVKLSGATASVLLRRALTGYLAQADRAERVLRDPEARAALTPLERVVMLYRLGGAVGPDFERALDERGAK